ncbi:hypothetical protein ACSVDE_17400 [Pseudalkalibacillus sp. Hm43]|uniref:hypothetical protein n=1 Tax=Pseudalkalibacillus sp. Hm43 TaxID=3450742 RepID=UPI003F43F862
MKKHQMWAAILSFSAGILIYLGYALAERIQYAPTIGWISALICLIIAYKHALKAHRYKQLL